MIYLDNAATTQPTKEVISDIMKCLEYDWGNPSSPYQEGRTARDLVEDAREKVAKSINAKPSEIIFTSSGSEANNLAIKGFCDMYYTPYLFTTEIEHSSVYNTCRYIDQFRRSKLKYIPLNHNGSIRLDSLEKMLKDGFTKNSLISVMYVNNEIGTIQPIRELAKLVYDYECYLHVDAVQAYPHMRIDVEDLGVDMLSVSGHKFGCPKGIGFLYLRDGVELAPLIHGGDQEYGLRGGTENVPYIYAMGQQVERLKKDDSVTLIGRYLFHHLMEECGSQYDIRLNGAIGDDRLWNNLNLTFRGFDAQTLITMLNDRGVCVSAGSACNAGRNTPSRVLKAIGVSDEDAMSTLRISINEHTATGDCAEFVSKLKTCLNFLA